VPDGFRVTLFAGEPDVAQPISMAFDERGRLWIAECYSYESSGGPWKSAVRDRILIFEDTDGDGSSTRGRSSGTARTTSPASSRDSAASGLHRRPNVIFIPDKDRDDVPDGPPTVILDGWNDGKIGHCVVNGLQWGPDGWLYGNQGIQGESKVGKPGAPDAERVLFNGGIWRYHPVKKVFEVVCEGTTNPWGLDWDDHGQAFFTNCVIGHLWHVVPGAHYERMYGKDYTPNTYGLIKSCSDHLHFAGKDWAKSRGGAEQDAVGGGHAHAGAMIYLGDNWPASTRGQMFMVNIHGRRVNTDLLERRGSGYVGRHGPDFLRSADPWFRSLNLKYGPDGGVFINDWADVGECHDQKSVHRTSGRIYKVVHGTPKPVEPFDLAKKTDLELVALQLHPNEWWVRQSRRVLQERAIAGRDLAEARAALARILAENPDATRKLRALWSLHVTGGADLVPLLDHENEHVRAWAVRLVTDERKPLPEKLASDGSPLVRLFVASALQKTEPAARWPFVEKLAQRAEDAEDALLPLMIWYATEPLVKTDLARASKLAADTKIPLLRTSIARRIASGN
jgi:putative membrane-bound dehydrogenase-like protein